MALIDKSRFAALVLSIAVASLVGGGGVILMGVMQQNAVPEVLRGRVWADGWKSVKQIRQESKYFAFLEEDASERRILGAPQSSLIATRKLIAGGVVLLTFGSGLLAWYVVDLKLVQQKG